MGACDTSLDYALSLTVLGQSGEPLEADQVTWTTNDGREGEGECIPGTRQPDGGELCEKWYIGPDDFRADPGDRDHEAEFTISVQCGSKVEELSVNAEGDQCHWDTKERTITFDDRDSC